LSLSLYPVYHKYNRASRDINTRKTGDIVTNEELNAALVISKKIYRLQCKLDDLRATGGVGATGNSTPVQGGQGADPGQLAAELSQEIACLQRQLAVEQTIIGRYIEKLPLSELENKVMILRYVKCRDWKNIAFSIGYSQSRMFDFHVSAMSKFGVNRS